MWFEFLARPLFLFYFAIVLVIFALVMGRFTDSDFWKNVDLYYYLFGILGVISFFVSETVPAKRSDFLKFEYQLANQIWDATVPIDPRLGVTSEEWIAELQSMLTPFEAGVRAGCEAEAYEHVCRIRNTLEHSDFKLGQFAELANAQGLEHKAACELFSKYVYEYLGPALDAENCVNFDRGKYVADEYLQGQFTKLCGDTSKARYSDYIEEYHPRSLLMLVQNSKEALSEGTCAKLNSFLAAAQYSRDQKEKEWQKYREADQNFEESSNLTSFLRSPVFALLWPYVLILGLSLKLAKWSAGTMSKSARGRRGSSSG